MKTFIFLLSLSTMSCVWATQTTNLQPTETPPAQVATQESLETLIKKAITDIGALKTLINDDQDPRQKLIALINGALTAEDVSREQISQALGDVARLEKDTSDRAQKTLIDQIKNHLERALKRIPLNQ